MAVFLKDVAGEPLASFSQGSSQWASGGSNGGSAAFGQPSGLFAANLNRGDSATTPAPISSTTASSTSDLGYQDLSEGHGISGSMMNPQAPSAPGRQLNDVFSATFM